VILRRLAGVLFWLSLLVVAWLVVMPQESLPSVKLWDKAAHTLAFLGLMLLCGIAYRQQLKLSTLVLLLFAFGVAIEIVQYLLPHRQFSLLDMAANSLGILAALPLMMPIERLLRIQTT
jgi:VanZ family protein